MKFLNITIVNFVEICKMFLKLSYWYKDHHLPTAYLFTYNILFTRIKYRITFIYINDHYKCFVSSSKNFQVFP